jgi:dCMP deaminase
LYPQVSVLTKATLKELNRQSTKIVMPNEEIMHSLAETYLPQHAVIYVDTFLRWDKVKTSQPVTVTPDTTISDRDFEAKLLELAETVAQASSDWWRRVGAVLTKNGRVLGMAANHHLPSAYQPYYDGDPRANFHKGQSIELTTAIHAEAKVIAQAAKEGSSTANCDLYVTTFPCPVCAKLIAAAGIKNLYYRDPYAMLDGESVLRQAGVTLIAVERSS